MKLQSWRMLLMCGVLVCSAFSATVNAAITERLTFYGTLQNSSGDNLTGTYDMVFRFYDASTAGNLLETSTHTAGNGNAVTVSNGEFSVVLGSGAGNSLDGLDFNTTPIYVGLSIQGDSEMSPRELLTSAAYSFNSDQVDGYHAEQLLRYNATGSITATAADTLFTLTQNGAGDIFNIFDGLTEVFTILDGGNIGFGSSTPARRLSVAGDAVITGALYDNSASAGTNGMVLQTTGSGFAWVATSTLGLGGGGGSLFTDGGASTYLTDIGDNLAIGSTSATSKLSVAGSINIDDANSGLNVLGNQILMADLTDGNYLFGQYAGASLTASTDNNIAIGYGAARTSTAFDFDDNIYIGYEAGYAASDDLNVVIGYQAGYNNSGGGNVLIGDFAGYNNGANANVGLGSDALYNNTGSANYGVGFAVGYNNTGLNNVFFGRVAGYDNTGDLNVSIGDQAGEINTGDENVFIGYQAGEASDGNNNIFIGEQAGEWNDGNDNIAMGRLSGHSSFALNGVTSTQNIAMGLSAADSLYGADNISFGYDSGVNGNSNDSIFIGSRTGAGFSESFQNVFIGHEAGYFNSLNPASNTVAIGARAMGGGSGGSAGSTTDNTVIGAYAGEDLSYGSNNILLGYRAGDNLATLSNNIIIGYDIDHPGVSGNRLNIGNLIFGTGIDGTGTTLSTGNIGIGTSAPTQKLSVTGSAIITGALYDNSASAGTNGMVLQTTGSGFAWVATSTLGLGGSNPFGASIDESELNITGSPTNGYLLQASSTAAGGFAWVATSTLGLGGSGGSLFTDGGASTYLTDIGDNLAIGSTSATSKLSVAGSINIDSASGLISQLETPIITTDLADFNYTFGHLAGQFFTASTDQNIAIGYAAGQNASTTFMDQSVYVGHEAGRYESGGNSTLIGYQAGQFTSGSSNTMAGWRAGRNNTGNESVFIGYQAGEDGFYDFATFVGVGAGDASALYTGEYNTALGYAAFQVAQGNHNIAAGFTSANNLAGDNNIALGQDAGIQINGNNNIAIGEDAGGNSIALGPDGNDNIFLGRTSGYFNQGSDSVFIGRASGYNMNATNSIAVGTQALARSNLTGSPESTNSVALGYRAGYESSANNNIFIGYQAADNSVIGTNNIVLGYDVDLPSAAGNNQLNIGNLIFGTSIDGTGTATSSGNIGIGTSTPGTKLMVAGAITPSQNNTFTIGNSTYRWSEVFATNGVINTSDQRLKENVAALGYGLEEILALEPVSFTWIDNPEQGTKLGFIAQDVQNILPEIINVGNDADKTLGIRYTELFAVVINAIHELWQTVTGNTERIAELEARVNALEHGSAKATAKSPQPSETDTEPEVSSPLPPEPPTGTTTDSTPEDTGISELDDVPDEAEAVTEDTAVSYTEQAEPADANEAESETEAAEESNEVDSSDTHNDGLETE